MIGKRVSPKILFLVSGIWFTVAALWMWHSLDYLTTAERQLWGAATLVVFFTYFLLLVGWLVPLLWATIKLCLRRPV
jgi:hypothetical protein